MNPKSAFTTISLLFLLFVSCASAVVAQTTTFTYQGRLTDGGTPANGNYDLQFALWSSNSGGTQNAFTRTVSAVPVSAGIFTVQLDLGVNAAWPGADRFLEIAVRPAGVGAFITLSPRQQITSTPYAIRSLMSSSADTVLVNDRTVIGSFAGTGSGNFSNALAIGFDAEVDQSDSLVLGSVAGVNNAAASVNVGIGTTTPKATLHVKGGTLLETGGSGGQIQFGTPNGETGIAITGNNRADVRFDGSTLKLVAGLGPGAQPSTNGIAITTAGRVGIGTTSPGATLEVKGQAPIAGLRVLNSSGLVGLVVRDDLTVAIGQLSSSASSTHVCLDGTGTLSFCTSSLRYKQQVAPYRAGLDLIRRLHPISFTWKSNGIRDFGLGAEDVAEVEPLLVTHNNAGEIQGVKYDQLNVVLINAIKQQQDQIERQQAAANQQQEQIARQQLQIKNLQQQQRLIKLQEGGAARQQQQIDSLKRLVCLNHPRADICK